MIWQEFTDAFPSELRPVILYRLDADPAGRRYVSMMLFMGNALNRGWFNQHGYLGVEVASRESWETLGNASWSDSPWTHWAYVDLPNKGAL